jgi:predicted nuclease of restriction endonuclease-like (RecB) superfamily
MIRTDKNLIDTTNPSVDVTYQSIREILEKARSTAYRTINYAMVQAYWHVGKVIVEEEQKGKEKAEYGQALIKELSKKLTKEYGRGLNERNLWHIRNFYLIFPKVNALRSELSWTHYRLLLRVENEDARHFYIIESIDNNWSTRELERQINSLLFERIALSKNKERVKELSTKGHVIQKPEDIIKDPYVLEFLNLRESKDFMEIDLEQGLIEKLQEFLLELGKGFAFVARQKRITIDGDHFYIDLVFYNYLLRCFLLIDLKIGKLTHKDIGQMDFYVRYFEHEVKQESDSPTIGLILCSDKNEAMVKYTLLENSQRIFASKYKLYLPSEEELKEELVREKQFLELELKEKRTSKLLEGGE